ncbi:MAG: hypothetical protein R3F49_01700 [Planctomycetota bacterium]
MVARSRDVRGAQAALACCPWWTLGGGALAVAAVAALPFAMPRGAAVSGAERSPLEADAPLEPSELSREPGAQRATSEPERARSGVGAGASPVAPAAAGDAWDTGAAGSEGQAPGRSSAPSVAGQVVQGI